MVGILLVKRSNEIILEKQNLVALSSSNDSLIRNEVENFSNIKKCYNYT